MQNYIELACRTEAPISEALLARLDSQARVTHAIFGLIDELGEYVKRVKEFVFYNKPVDHTNKVEELGDFLWYLALLMNETGISFEEVMRANIAKLQKRYPNKFSEHDAVNRDLAAERTALEDFAEKNKTSEGPTIDSGCPVPIKHFPAGEDESTVLILARKADKLQKFKDYVHERLDKAGIPKFPEEQCRIGKRLDWIFEQYSRVGAREEGQ